MQEIYDRTQILESHKNFFPSLCEFSKELATNPLLESERQDLLKVARVDFESLSNLRGNVFEEIDDAKKNTIELCKRNSCSFVLFREM